MTEGLRMALSVASIEELNEYAYTNGLQLVEVVTRVNSAMYSCDSNHEEYVTRAQRTLSNR